MGEYLHPKESHRWLILEIDGKIVMVDKDKVGFLPSHDMGNVFLDFLPKYSIGFKLLQYTHGNIQTIRYEWEGDIELIVNPTDEKYLSYFRDPWSERQMHSMIPSSSMGKELWDTTKGFSTFSEVFSVQNY